jgi:hypothetical protein
MAVLKVLVFLCLAAPALASGPMKTRVNPIVVDHTQCLREMHEAAMNPESAPFLHRAVTDRPFDKVVAAILGPHLEYDFPTADMKAIPRFDPDSIAQGEVSFLALGEGYSNLFSTLFDRRKAAGLSTDDMHSNDYAYSPEHEVFYQRLNPDTKKRVRENPSNYSAYDFENMNLRNPDGSRKQFSEVVSMSSLNYVLSRMETSFTDSSVSRQHIERILLNLLEHVSSGGVLRIANDFYTNLWRTVEVLHQLKAQGRVQRMAYGYYEIGNKSILFIFIQKADD